MRIAFILVLILLTNIDTVFSQRIKYSINDSWQFKKENIPYAKYADFDDSKWETVYLPHTWNTEDVLDDDKGYYRGIGWYRKFLKLPESYKGKKIFIYFEGANQETELFVNGESAGKHIGGYAGFCFDITDKIILGLKNSLSIKISNAHNPTITPLVADYNFYGGIYRDIHLIITNPIHFNMLDNGSSGVYWQTPEVTSEFASVKIKGSLSSELKNNTEVIISTKITNAKGESIKSITSKYSFSKITSFEQNLKIEKPLLWSPETPYLYTLTTQIIDIKSKKIIDEVINPIGFRWFSFDANKGFFLNGKSYKLIGANRHQDLKGKGNALSDVQHYQDLELIKNMGGNFVRIAHFPQDPTVYEACDKLGLIVTTEIPAQNQITEDEQFYVNCENMQREMIRQHHNHPSIFIWAYFNEIFLDEWWMQINDRTKYKKSITALGKRLEAITRNEDPYRYTMICNHNKMDQYIDAEITSIPMIVGWNLYYGWYEDDFEVFDNFLKKHKEKLPNKPVIITEFGAGSDQRIHSFEPKRFDFSIEWQDKFLEYYLRTIQKTDFVCGGAVWNFIDFQSEYRSDCMPHINNKGMVTTDRIPKDCYYLYQSILTENPTIKIATSSLTKRSGIPDNENAKFCTQPIWVYTNCESVNLFLNGISQGVQEVKNNKVNWNIPFSDGASIISAIGTKNGVIARDFMNIQFKMLPYNLKNEEFKFKEININCGGEYYYTDNENQLWLPDKEYKAGSYGFVGGEKYSFSSWNGTHPATDRNVLGTDEDRLYQSLREGMTAYQFDLPNGVYEISLGFAELLNETELAKADTLTGKIIINNKSNQRIFNVEINDTKIIENLDLSAEYGSLRAINRRYEINCTGNNGIKISFIPIKGNSIINNIRIRRVW